MDAEAKLAAADPKSDTEDLQATIADLRSKYDFIETQRSTPSTVERNSTRIESNEVQSSTKTESSPCHAERRERSAHNDPQKEARALANATTVTNGKESKDKSKPKKTTKIATKNTDNPRDDKISKKTSSAFTSFITSNAANNGRTSNHDTSTQGRGTPRNSPKIKTKTCEQNLKTKTGEQQIKTKTGEQNLKTKKGEQHIKTKTQANEQHIKTKTQANELWTKNKNEERAKPRWPRYISAEETSFDQDYNKASGMGRDAGLPSIGPDRANSHQPHDEDTNELQLEPGIRRGPHPSTTTSTATPSLGNFELTNQDEGDPALNDTEANKQKPMTIWEDNNACIQLGHGLKGSKSAKHFETRLRFLNEHIIDKTIEFARIDTKDQLADGFTKPLPLPAFRAFRSRLLQSPQ